MHRRSNRDPFRAQTYTAEESHRRQRDAQKTIGSSSSGRANSFPSVSPSSHVPVHQARVAARLEPSMASTVSWKARSSTTRTKDTTDQGVPRPLLRPSPGWARPLDVREASKQPHPNGNRTTTWRLHGNCEAHGDVSGRAEPGKSNHPARECEEIGTSRLQFVLPSLGLARPGREDALQAASCRRLLRDALDVVHAETPCIRGETWIEGRPCHIHVGPPTRDPVVKDTVALL